MDELYIPTKTAFLKGLLLQIIYMEVSEGVNIPEGMCCLLLKSLYGLKQSPREWHACLTSFLQLKGFEWPNFDPCLFMRQDPLCLINIYVDDLFVFTEKDHYLKKITQELSKKFEIINAGPISFGLGIYFT